MSCEMVIGSVVALFDEELAADERQVVESHLASCRACAREADGLRATRAVLARHLASVAARRSAPRFEDIWQRVAENAIEPPAEAPDASHGHRSTAVRPAAVSRPRHGKRRWLVAGTSAGFALAAGLALMVFAPSSSRDATRASGDASRGATSVAARPASETVAARPAKAPATRVAKAAPSAAEPAKELVARRANPKPAVDATSEDLPHEDAVAANEPHEAAVAVNELDPPRELLERPDLFLNYPIMRKLDELRHLDAVLADQDADGQSDDGGAG